MLRPRHSPLRVPQLGGISLCSATLPGLVSNTHCIHIPRKAPLCAAGNSQAKSIEEAFVGSNCRRSAIATSVHCACLFQVAGDIRTGLRRSVCASIRRGRRSCRIYDTILRIHLLRFFQVTRNIGHISGLLYLLGFVMAYAKSVSCFAVISPLLYIA